MYLLHSFYKCWWANCFHKVTAMIFAHKPKNQGTHRGLLVDAELDQNINIKYNFTPLAYWRLCESSGRVLQHLDHWSCRSCSGIRLHFNSLTSQAHSLITSLSSSQLSQLIIISNAQTEIKTFRSAS